MKFEQFWNWLEIFPESLQSIHVNFHFISFLTFALSKNLFRESPNSCPWLINEKTTRSSFTEQKKHECCHLSNWNRNSFLPTRSFSQWFFFRLHDVFCNENNRQFIGVVLKITWHIRQEVILTLKKTLIYFDKIFWEGQVQFRCKQGEPGRNLKMRKLRTYVGWFWKMRQY